MKPRARWAAFSVIRVAALASITLRTSMGSYRNCMYPSVE